MIIKGGSRGGAGQLAGHLLCPDTNEQVTVTELRGVAATTLPAALHEMMQLARGSRCRKPLYHASINTGPGEALMPAQKAQAIDTLEHRLGLAGHARAVVEHRKEGRDHLHVVWCRIHPRTLKAAHDGFNYRRHEDVARQLERAFGHRPVQGAHVERNGCPRPARTPPAAEIQQAARTKVNPAGITAEVTALWQAADSGTAFAAALAAAGYVLARGDRRGFCIIDQAGGAHSLARRLAGVTTAEVNARLQEIDLDRLPSVAEARAQIRQPAGAEKPRQDLGRDPRAERTTDPRASRAARPASPRPARSSQPGTRAIRPPAKPAPAPAPAAGGVRPAAQPPGRQQHSAGQSRSAAVSPPGSCTRPGAPNTERTAAMPSRAAAAGIAANRPAVGMLRVLGMAGGGGRRGIGPPLRVAVAGTSPAFFDPRPVFLPRGGAAARVAPVKGTAPERVNLRRPDGPSTESMARVQLMIERLTAYGLSTGEAVAEQLQELRVRRQDKLTPRRHQELTPFTR